MPTRLVPKIKFTTTHNKPHPTDTTSHNNRKETVFHSLSIKLPTKSTIKPLKIRFIGESLINGYVTNCQIRPRRTLRGPIARTPVVKPGANVKSNTPVTNRTNIITTPGVKSFVGDGKFTWVCCEVYMLRYLLFK
jgi:hypothetical protein